MQTPIYSQKGGRIRSCLPPAFLSVFILLLLGSNRLFAAGVVTSCTEADLRAAMAGGGLVTFATDGTITLNKTITNSLSTVLDATGHQITVSGNNSVRVFDVDSNGILTLLNVTISNGRSTKDGGGGIYSEGMVNATNCAFYGNTAVGSNGIPPYQGDGNGTDGQGGGIFNRGTLCASRCVFLGNSAFGGDGASGGGVALTNLPSWRIWFGGSGCGGAIFNLGIMQIDQSLLASNSVHGGGGGGGYSWTFVMPWNLYPGSTPGGGGGDGTGGAIFNCGTGNLINCTLAWNQGNGGGGGVGGMFWDGATFSRGDGGGMGGLGIGGIFSTNGSLGLTNLTMSYNAGNGGSGGNGGSASRQGPGARGGDAVGGIYRSGGIAKLLNCIVAFNIGSGGPGGWGVFGPPPYHYGQALSGSSITNAGGTITDAGFNISSDGNYYFPTNTRSMKNTDPKLGPLADSGGPTFTVALLPGSPAIDGGAPTDAITSDQRGVSRPQGLTTDIGAFEYQFTVPQIISAKFLSSSNFWFQSCGLPSQTYVVQASTNLLNWHDLTNVVSDPNGVSEFVDHDLPGYQLRFYRLRFVSP